MKTAIRFALFCAVLLSMGVLLGVYVSFFARKYADDELKQSKRQRDQYRVIIHDDGA